MGKKKNNNRQGAATGSPVPADESGTPDAATPTPASPVTADAAPAAASPAADSPAAPEAATVNDENPAPPAAVEQQHHEQPAQASESTPAVAESSKTDPEDPAAAAVAPVAESSADAGAQVQSEPPTSSAEGKAEPAEAQEAVAEVPVAAPAETPASQDDAAPSSTPAVEEAAPAAVEPQPTAEEATEVAPKESDTSAIEPEATAAAPVAAAPAESEAAAPTEEPQPVEPEATAPEPAEAAAPPAAGDDAVTPKRKAQRSGSKKPRSASKTPANKRSSSKPAGTAGGASTAKKRSPSASAKKTPRSASKGASTTVKKAIAVAAAHIPKRALSFGRNRSTADAPVAVEASPITAASPTSDGVDASPSHETNPAASPSPMRRENSALFSGSMNMSVSFSRKTVLRLYGETAEHATDAKTRATALRNVGWIYATGTTDAPVNLEKAYAYFYHAAKDGDEAARFYMAQLQLKRNLAPELSEWNPNSVGTDEAMSARRAGRGRSASPRRGSKSPARAKSPGLSKKRANANPTGPFGGLKKAIENLELCAAAGNAEAMLELAFLYDPTMPAPAGYVAPAAAAAPADTAAPAAAASKTPRPSVTAATALTPKGNAAADAAAPVAPVLVRAMDVARSWYAKAAEAGSVTASMRLEDLDANEARAVTDTGRTFTRYSGPAAA